MQHKFQVNLSGIIDLLSHHLYSSPSVYVRELLQNGVDAITARRQFVTDASVSASEGRIDFRLESEAGRPVLICRDNGIGLTEEETHQFLAVIGQSSKREELSNRRGSFIGQFGIGLLSCFLVSDEITVTTRSQKNGGAALCWRGTPDGVYTVETLEAEFEPGTEVVLKAKPGSEEYFKPERVRSLLTNYGHLLPYKIIFRAADGLPAEQINLEKFPWENFTGRSLERYDRQRKQEMLDYGRRVFDIEFIDCFPLETQTGKISGLAYVLPFSPHPGGAPGARVYLKGMLLSEQVKNLLPDWAFFAAAIINADQLQPTASREALQESDALAAAREAIGEQIRRYTVEIADDPLLLRRFLHIHERAIKEMAVYDDEIFRLFIHKFEFETTAGRMSVEQLREKDPLIRYAPSLDDFRQIKPIAAAQSLFVINAGYGYDRLLMEKISEQFPQIRTQAVDAHRLSYQLSELDFAESGESVEFMRRAESILRRFGTTVEMRKFAPSEMPVIYSLNEFGVLRRSAEDVQEAADPLWASVMDAVLQDNLSAQVAVLCFNFENKLVRKLCRLAAGDDFGQDGQVFRLLVELLYVQALLAAHQSLRPVEQELLNEGLLRLVDINADFQLGDIA